MYLDKKGPPFLVNISWLLRLSVAFLSLLNDLINMVVERIIIKIISKSPTVIPRSLRFIIRHVFSLIYPFLLNKLIIFTNLPQNKY